MERLLTVKDRRMIGAGKKIGNCLGRTGDDVLKTFQAIRHVSSVKHQSFRVLHYLYHQG
jgi:hypothetical protein